MVDTEIHPADEPVSGINPNGGAAPAGTPFSLTGIVSAYTAPTSEPGAITIGGLPFPIAPGTLLAGDSVAPGLRVNLDARLDASGRIAQGTAKRQVVEGEQPFWTPFWLQLSYLVLLIAGGLLYHAAGHTLIVKQLHDFVIALFPNSLGPIPVSIPWLAALGAVTRGLANSYGEVDLIDRSPYRPRHYNTMGWYIARPFMGAAFGIFVFLFFLTVLDPTGQTKPGGAYGIDILAFVIGYADGTFVALIQRAINVLLGPGDAASGGTGHSRSVRPDSD